MGSSRREHTESRRRMSHHDSLHSSDLRGRWLCRAGKGGRTEVCHLHKDGRISSAGAASHANIYLHCNTTSGNKAVLVCQSDQSKMLCPSQECQTSLQDIVVLSKGKEHPRLDGRSSAAVPDLEIIQEVRTLSFA